eukprot:11192459-Lingulodinium_polyedra.AAC.1
MMLEPTRCVRFQTHVRNPCCCRVWWGGGGASCSRATRGMIVGAPRGPGGLANRRSTTPARLGGLE